MRLCKGYSGRSVLGSSHSRAFDITEKNIGNLVDKIYKLPVGTEITQMGQFIFYDGYKSTLQRKYRITGTLRHKVLEPIHTDFDEDKMKRINLKSTTNLRSFFPIEALDNEKLIMRRTALTAEERKAQKAESLAERRQMKIKF